MNFGPTIVKEGLVLHLDASDKMSYSGGTGWRDLSPSGYVFMIPSACFQTSGNISYMNCASGIAKRIVSSALSNVPNYTSGTICVFSTIQSPNGDWKTLVRGGTDHHAIIADSDGVSLGMFDGNSAGWLAATGSNGLGYSVSSLSDRTNTFHFMAWKLTSTAAPYNQFFYDGNVDTPTAAITNANATFNEGFCSIGGYHNGVTGSGSYSQSFGSLSVFLYYNRGLTAAELRQNYEAFRYRFKV